MQVRKSLLAVALSVLALSAHASSQTVQGSAGIGGQITIGAGAVSGNVGVQSGGSAGSAATVIGNGSAFEAGYNVNGGTASINGATTVGGTTVGANTTQYSVSQAVGYKTGNTPAMSGDAISTGVSVNGNTNTVAGVTGSFAQQTLAGSFNVAAFGTQQQTFNPW